MERIFIISKQKCGTTSTAQFLEDHGIRVARADGLHNRLWSLLHFSGKHDVIFESQRFQEFRAFEDDPWWHNGMLNILLNRFPTSKFILLKRDPDEWFDSLRDYLNQRPHFSLLHALEYPRTVDYHSYLMDNRRILRNHSMFIEESHRKSYTMYLRDYYSSVERTFQEQGRCDQLFSKDLNDENKWVALGEFLSLQVDSNYTIHLNKAVREKRAIENRLVRLIRDIRWALRSFLKN